MPRKHPTGSLYDPRCGGQVICLNRLRLDAEPSQPPRTNYFSIYLIQSGTGFFWADAARFTFGPGCLLFFVPYQQIRLVPDSPVVGEVLQFHANFLCVETFHAEAGCSGVLFNDPAGVPAVILDEPTCNEVAELIERVRTEQQQCGLGFHEMMLAHLKVLLILATRCKSVAPQARPTNGGDPRHPVIVEFRQLIEEHYCRLHGPAEYARLLHITPKTLGRIVRENLGTTPTELIRSRILTHAKWQLLHTLRPVKEIAREVGYQDELYFSRFFKKGTGYSPTFFREFETEIRGGSNLSMFSSHPSILASANAADNSLQESHTTSTGA